jgi:hypothetical protein
MMIGVLLKWLRSKIKRGLWVLHETFSIMENPSIESRFYPTKEKRWLGQPFDPREVNNNFTEGNAWQYTFVPQDIPNDRSLCGER